MLVTPVRPYTAGVTSGDACPACGGPLSAWRSVTASEPGLAGQRFELWRCDVCGTAVTAGPAPDLHDSGAFRPGTPRLHSLARPVLGRFDAQRLSLLRRLATPGARVLDAGAGQGRFVAAARRAGYDARGLEPSRRGIDRAAARGVRLIPAGIEQAEIQPGSLDAITLWHVLEHLDRPDPALARIADWLRPGGGLLLGLPNLDSWQARLGGARWFHLDVPRHRTHFTVEGVRRLLHRHGLAPVAIHHLLLEHNPYGMWQSAVNALTERPSYLYNLLKRNAPLSAGDAAVTLAALGLLPVAALAELLAGLARRGGTIAVLARRV
jgi:SAM-dependent methyltransferase